LHYVPKWGWGAAIVLLLVVDGVALGMWHHHWQYSLAQSSQQLVGHAEQHLASQLHYKNGVYHFNNAKNKKQPFQQKTGKNGHALYGVTIAQNMQKGIGYRDRNTGLGFHMAPEFAGHNGSLKNGHMIFPLKSGAQAVYTLKGNGLKEDLLFRHAPSSGQAIFRYKLDLPKTLEARAMKSGGIGIYSANPMLYSNITTGTNADKAKLTSARQSAPKNHLLFVLPAPKITTVSAKCQMKQQQGCDHQASHGAWASLQLNGDEIVLKAGKLQSIHGSFSIDPSVVVTSTSDFIKSHASDNISYGTDGQVTRGDLSGGSVEGWNTSTPLPAALNEQGSAVYNGYIYTTGGLSGTTTISNVYYAPLQSNGKVGSWTADSAINLPGPRRFHSTVAYEGYLYVIGGSDGANNKLDSVYYTKLGSNGRPTSPGSCSNVWCQTATLPGTSTANTSVVYNGYIYLLDGTGTMATTDVAFAKVNANGSLGAWKSAASLPSALNGVSFSDAAVYNGYVYISGGYNSSTSTYEKSVYYARLHSDGTIGSWQQATASLPTALANHAMLASDGYLYVTGGANSGGDQAAVYYAPVYTNGQVGTWRSTVSLPVAISRHTSVAANGYLYALGGGNAAAVQYAKITPEGTTDGYTATKSFTDARANFGAVAHGGYLYVAGGNCNSCSGGYSDGVQAAQVGADGQLGSWAAVNTFSGARGSLAVAASDGYMYISGGNNGQGTSVEYAPFTGGGQLGSWQSTTALPQSMSEHAMTAYGGYVYVFANGSASNNVYYAKIQPDGTLGNWQQNSTSFSGARTSFEAVAYGGYVYVLGGQSGGSELNDVQYAKIGDDGSLGSWSSANNFPTARSNFAAVADRGYLYVLGGSGDSGTLHDDVQYARINLAGGTLGSWQATQSFTTARNSFEGVAYDGYLYVLGGYGSGQLNDVQSARINNGGSGAAASWQSSSNKFATARAAHQSVVHNGYLYVLGGQDSNGDYLTDVQYAQLGDDGTVGTWTTDTGSPLPLSGRAHFGVAISNGNLYITGGETSGDGAQATAQSVYFAKFNADGSLGAWQQTTKLPSGRYKHTSFAYKNHLYTVGGAVNVPTGLANFEDNGSCIQPGAYPITEGNTTYPDEVFNAAFNMSSGSSWAANKSQSYSNPCSLDTANDTDQSISFSHTFTHDGFIGFARKITTSGGYYGNPASLTFSINGVQQESWNSTQDWQLFVYPVQSGQSYTFTWQYTASTSPYGYSSGEAWLDDIQFIDNNQYKDVFSYGFENGTLATPDPNQPDFQTAGDANWTATTNQAHTGNYSAQSGALSGTGNSDMTLTVTVSQLSTLSFARKVHAERGCPYRNEFYCQYFYGYTYDDFLFSIDGSQQNDWTENQNWQIFTYKLSPGTHTLRWRYERNNNGSSGNYHGWVDDVKISSVNPVIASTSTLTAPIDPSTGQVGQWSALSNDIPGARSGQGSVVYNGYVYVFGGLNGKNKPTANTSYAKINDDGTLGTWHSTASLPEKLSDTSATVFNGFVYVLGGRNGNNNSTASAYYAPINADGTLGNWQATNALPAASSAGAATSTGGYVYMTGGESSNDTNNVYYAPLQSIPRVANYSKLVDFDTDAGTIANISYSGDVPGGLGAISYRSAGTDGVFGATQAATDLTGKKNGTIICASQISNKSRYVWVHVRLDDTQRAVFPDTNHAHLDSLDVSYNLYRIHPPPNLRLRAGQYFHNGVIQPLDTCPTNY
jgi:N-acetylneuraminic acid mutarotase